MSIATPENDLLGPAPWEAAAVERQVLRITCACLGYKAEDLSLEARLGAELPVDSLDLIEYIAELETAFHITMPVSNAAYARFLESVAPVPAAVLREWCLPGSGDRREQHFPLLRSRRGWQPVLGAEQQPMILVTWYGANAYSLWANRRDWRRYRGDGSIPAGLQDRPVAAAAPPEEWLGSLLPSEAQWEYAARGGEARRYPWGDDPPTAERVCLACHVRGAAYTAGTLPAARVSERLGMSPFGLHHMAGNVWQWCRDWYAPDFYRRPEALQTDAQNRQATGIRCERGGSWVGPERLARSSYRRGRPPEACGRCLGFRCAAPARDLP
jgi:acyl carrier protein